MLLSNKNRWLFGLTLEKIKKNKRFWGTLFLTVIFLAINNNLLRGNAVGIWDSDGQFVAYQILIADYARAGKFALWDVWSNAGTPILGDPQIGAFSPLNVFFGFLFGGSTLGFRFYWLFVWWLGGFGVLMLGRHFRTNLHGSIIIALGYLFCGVYITNAEHISWLVGFSFLPIIIWRLDAALRYRRLIPALQAGGIWGVSALSAYPGFTILTILYCGVWAAGRLFIENRIHTEDKIYINRNPALQRPTFHFVFISLLLSSFVGIMILSPTYFSFFYENSGTTTRGEALNRESILVENPLHLGAVSSFASPYIPVQKLYNKDLWAGTDVSMTSIYAGGIISVLALFSLINNYKDKWRWFLVFLALLALTCSLSQVFPFRGWLYDLVYPTRYFRHSSIFRAYYLFSITILALFGMRDLTRILSRNSIRSWRSFKLSSQILAVSAILVFISVINSLTALGGKIHLAYAHLFIIWIGICLIPYIKNNFFNQYRQIIPVFLMVLAIFDAFCVYRLSQSFIVTDDAALVQRWRNLDSEHSSKLDLTATGLQREESSCYEINQPCRNLNNDQMIKKIPVFSSYNTQVNNFQVETAKNPLLENMVTGSERIWFSTQVAEIQPTAENFSKFIKRTSELGVAPLVIHTPQDMINAKFNSDNSGQSLQSQPVDLENLPASEKLNVRVIKYTPEELIFETEAPSDGWLLLTDRWARMWKADINNQPTVVYGGNFIFRAVKIPAGHSTVHFVYRLISFPYLLVLSWGILGILTVISVWDKLKRDSLSACNENSNIPQQISEKS